MAMQAPDLLDSDAAMDLATGAGHYAWDASVDRMAWSIGLLRLYGLAKVPEDEDEFLHLVHPDDRLTVEAETTALLGGGADRFSRTFRVVRPDGAVRRILDRGLIERDGKGRVRTVRGMHLDVTELQGSDSAADVARERARTDSEARLAAALRAGKLGVHELDPRTGAMEWDAAVRRIWGIRTDEQVTYQAFAAGVHPDDWPSVEAAVERAYDPEGAGHYSATYRVINRQSGAVRWIRADGDVTFEGGTAARLVGTVKDITDSKLAEAALAESEARFRNMADNAPVMVWMTEQDGTCTYLNADWYRFTGQTAEQALGFGWLEAVHPDDAAQSEQIFRDATERKVPFRLNYRLRRADGVYRWAVDSARPRLGSDGSFLGFIGSVTDITDLKDIEQQLRAAHDTFQQLVERSPFGIFAVDSDFRMVQVSDGAQKVFANVRPLIGRDLAEVMRAVWPEPFATEIIGHYRHTLATGEPYHAPGTVERRADSDDTEAYDWKIEQVTMPDGRPGVVCHFYDLSERQAFEEKIQYLMREISHRAKNLLALVDAIARQTASTGREDFLERFSQRLGALAANQQLLLRSEWDGADLAALVESQLQPFKDLIGRRIVLDGPPVGVGPTAAQTLGMAMHELATNAAKYGALSTGAGQVTISWNVAGPEGQERFTMAWTEHDGPPVAAPERTGFGERVSRRMVERALSGEVALDYHPTGLVWRLRCPLAEVTTAAQGTGSAPS
jgi:PAS domain S-box-containing protein